MNKIPLSEYFPYLITSSGYARTKIRSYNQYSDLEAVQLRTPPRPFASQDVSWDSLVGCTAIFTQSQHQYSRYFDLYTVPEGARGNGRWRRKPTLVSLIDLLKDKTHPHIDFSEPIEKTIDKIKTVLGLNPAPQNDAEVKLTILKEVNPWILPVVSRSESPGRSFLSMSYTARNEYTVWIRMLVDAFRDEIGADVADKIIISLQEQRQPSPQAKTYIADMPEISEEQRANYVQFLQERRNQPIIYSYLYVYPSERSINSNREMLKTLRDILRPLETVKVDYLREVFLVYNPQTSETSILAQPGSSTLSFDGQKPILHTSASSHFATCWVGHAWQAHLKVNGCSLGISNVFFATPEQFREMQTFATNPQVQAMEPWGDLMYVCCGQCERSVTQSYLQGTIMHSPLRSQWNLETWLLTRFLDYCISRNQPIGSQSVEVYSGAQLVNREAQLQKLKQAWVKSD